MATPNPKSLLCPDYVLGDSKKQAFETDLSTCSRESVQIVTSLMASFKSDINSINTKTAFSQGKKIIRNIIKPPKEPRTKKLWKLNKSAYGLADAPRCWYLRLKDKLM